MPPKISRRNFLKGVAIAGASVLASKKARAIAKPGEPAMLRTARQHLLRSKLNGNRLKVYCHGLKGKGLADAYGVEFTRGPAFTPSQELVHDVKVLLMAECHKYNGVIPGFNERGEQLVNPYHALALMEVESRLNPNAHKKGDGTGIAQLTGVTRAELKALKQYPVNVTDAYDMQQSIAGMVRYLVHLNRQYFRGESRTAANISAAYRLGPTGAKQSKNRKIAASYTSSVQRAIQKLEREKALESYTQTL